MFQDLDGLVAKNYSLVNGFIGHLGPGDGGGGGDYGGGGGGCFGGHIARI